MKFKFTVQPYQTEAVESVVSVFAGQPYNDRFTYRRDVEIERDITNYMLSDEELTMGFANAKVRLDPVQLLDNIRRMQTRNNIKLTDKLTTNLGACSLDVEMETGTGKTYVYIKTMFELNKQYGWSKFIVVVPSIAIREGVKKSFETMQEHFMEHYGKKARFFIYDSKNLSEIDNFSQNSDISVMIINIQAFNSSFNSEKNKEGRAGDAAARIIFSSRDSFGSRRPIDVIAANHPIIIMDEPQKMGGEKTQKALKQFNPLFCLNYSATHKEHHELVYVLDALDAYNQQLVKRIEVKGFDIKNLRGTDSYLFLEGIVLSSKKPPMARIEFEIGYDKSINRETRIVGVDDDLFALSKNMEQYRGYRISEIDPVKNTVTFTNGEIIHTGEVVGDISETDLRRVQIRETIRSHFEKEKELFSRGIKTLSLFFIDEVAKYRQYDEDGNEINSLYGEIFEQEYTDILNEYLTLYNTPYEQYIRDIEPSCTHAGYFSIDKKGRKVDSTLKRGKDESDDISAYDLILKDKERLLSFENPVRFIFSHSALREGWDNPNVFQICTLKHGGSSATQKRQEVGRGLRLCVDQNGDRMDADTLGSLVQQVNQLTVIASDGYRDFVKSLQEGIREDLYERPTKATADYFTGKTIHIDGVDITISDKQGKDIYRYLIRNDYIDDDDHITQQYRADAANNSFAPLPESCKDIADGVQALIKGIFDEHALDDMVTDGHNTKVPDNALNDNFWKKEFQTLWNYINHKYAYTVEFDSEELIRKAVEHINEKMFVAKLQYTVTAGQQEQALDYEKLKSGAGFSTEKTRTFTLERGESSSVKYDLIGKVAEGTKLTRCSAARILSSIRPDVFAMYKNNPEEFITKAIRLINEEKATMIVDHISYNPTDGTYDSAIFTAEKNTDFSKAYRSKKNVQDYVFADGYAKDGKSVERRFAEDMDKAEEVCVYAKLPKGFSIPTPVGNYSPDWAIAFYEGTVKHIYFIAETKGTMDSLNLKPIEKAKIECAEKLFAQLSSAEVVYESDGNTPDFGGGLQHHLRDFAHHPTVIGLIFSLLTQFTEMSYGTDVNGVFKVIAVPEKSKIFIGKDIPDKLFKGTIIWFFHLVSDMAGSSITAGISGGTGIPGPILSLAKELSVLPIFQKINIGDKNLSIFLSKVFNGTLFAKYDKDGRIIKDTVIKFDLRGELGAVAELGKQAIPIIANDCIVRTFYFIRRFALALKSLKCSSLKDIEASNIDWDNVKPFKNPTIDRMLTISSTVFSTIDIAEAVITKKYFVAVNYVGVGRFAVAIGNEILNYLKVRDVRVIKKMYEDIRRNTYTQTDNNIYGRIENDIDIDKFGLTLEQTEILYNLEMYKTTNDIYKNPKKAELKDKWLEEWKLYMENGFSAFIGNKDAVLHWYSEQELYDAIISNSPEKPWFRLVLLEAMLFQPYFPLCTETDKNGKEIPSKKYKELQMPIIGYNKNNGDIFLDSFFSERFYQKGYVYRLRKCYNRVIKELNEVLKGAIISVSITAATVILAVVTAGAFAPAIAVALVGSNFAGLSGAALTSACLAYLGGGAIAAGGLGMAGGTMAIVGGGAVLGLGVGAGIGGTVGAAGIIKKEDTILQSAKLMVSVREVFLNDEHDLDYSNTVYEQYVQNITNIEKGLVELRLKADVADKEEKKRLNEQIKNAEESVRTMKIAMKSMNKFISSFDLGESIE